MHLLITGVAGFVGSRLARLLAARGERVSGTYLDERPDLPGVDLYRADLLDREALAAAVREADPDAVVNLAGLSHIAESWDKARMADYFWVNLVGTENVVAAAAGRRVVVASSADVYGAVPEAEQPIPEDRPIAPRSPYALTKAAAERLSLKEGAVVVRSFNLVGPGQDPKFALPAFAQQLAAIARGQQDPVLRVGNLTARRDFVHVDDGVEAYRLLAEKGEPGAVYNLASGRAVAIEDALARLMTVAGVTAEVEVDPEKFHPADLEILCGDSGRLRALGWAPARGLDAALADLWAEVSGG
jgi:GDP-4-dehydro-6-deoxy-D-mannose reductase